MSITKPTGRGLGLQGKGHGGAGAHHGVHGHSVAHPPNESGGVEHHVEVPAGGAPGLHDSYHTPSHRPASADHHSEMHAHSVASAEEFNTGHRRMPTPDRSGVLNADAQASDFGSQRPELTDSGGLRNRLREPDRGNVGSHGMHREHNVAGDPGAVNSPYDTSTGGGGTHSEASNRQMGRARVKGK
ncbi:MAG: hypothetical protein C5B59_17220 [Bacteroidetes bacterium]|nr:MAG: hypothetical protein C5B59_17220 [Bacteroidota bacterium]